MTRPEKPPPLSPDGALVAGARVDVYTITGRLGSGGAGLVLAATDAAGRRVALKTMLPAHGQDATQRARFLREARAAGEVDHPAIAPVLDTGTLADGRPYLVLPLFEGETLGQAIARRGAFAPEEAWRALRPVGEALAKAHAAGIVHRDVKPDNVFLARGEDGTTATRLLDFGLARALDPEEVAEAAKLTQTGATVGTPLYMAPEQWWGVSPSASVDQYAFGATLFEAITGRPPFDAASVGALVEKHLHAAAPSAAALGAPVSERADAFVRRLLAKDPSERFATMELALAAGDVAFGAAGEGAIVDPGLAETAGLEVAARITETASLAAAPRAAAAAGSLAEAARITETASLEAAPRAAAAGSIAEAARITETASVVVAPGIAGASRRRFLFWHAGALVIGFAVLVAVGYAGPDRRDVYEWLHIGGWVQGTTLLCCLLGAAMIPLGARRHPLAVPRSAFLWAVLPAISGALGAYPNWSSVERGLLRQPDIDAFRIFCQGSYEANTARFLGFALASFLCLSIVALPALSGASSSVALSSAVAVVPVSERRARLAILLSLAALAVAAGFLGAPSGALVSAIAAACLLATTLFPAPASAALPRAVAALLAVGLAFAVGITRVEGRQAVLWSEPLTRADRIAEIQSAHSEMEATLLVGVAALLAASVPFLMALARASKTAPLPRPSRVSWALALALLVAGGLDVTLHERVLARREELRAALSTQFASFVHLDPPPAGTLPLALDDLAPRRSTALQIARDAIAINGRPVTKLAALDTETGVFLVTAQLHQALAQASVDRGSDEVDLAVIADESVPFGRIVLLLSLARAGGAKRVDLLFRRGDKPRLSTDAPPETAYVVPSDFIAATVELADEGFSAPPDQRWSDIAPRLLDAFSDGRAVILQVPGNDKARL